MWVCICYSVEPPALPGVETQIKTLSSGKLHPCQGWQVALCHPISCWPQVFFFSPNVFALFSKSDWGSRGSLSWFPLIWNAHTQAHARTHFILTSIPGGEKSTLGCARFRLWGAQSFLQYHNGLIVQAFFNPNGRSAGQLKAHLEQPPQTLNPNPTAALLEPSLFS